MSNNHSGLSLWPQLLSGWYEKVTKRLTASSLLVFASTLGLAAIVAISLVRPEVTVAEESQNTASAATTTPAAATITYVFDLAASELKWEGSKVVGGAHDGTIGLKSGELVWGKGPVSSVVVVDMNTIVNTDLKKAGSKKKLEGHLKNEDFFHVTEYPEAKLSAKSFTATAKPDIYKVEGEITIRGVTEPITYETKLKKNDDGAVEGQGVLTIDRTKFNVKYNSARFFPDLGDKIIKDEFTLSYNFKAKSSTSASKS